MLFVREDRYENRMGGEAVYFYFRYLFYLGRKGCLCKWGGSGFLMR